MESVRAFGPDEDVVRVTPFKVRGILAEQTNVSPLEIARVGHGFPVAIDSIEEDETLPIRAPLDVVHMKLPADRLVPVAQAPNVSQGDEVSVFTCVQVQQVDGGIFRGQNITIRVREAWVSVPGALVLNPGEIRAQGKPAVRAHVIHGTGKCSHPARCHIEDSAHELISLPVIPEHFGL